MPDASRRRASSTRRPSRSAGGGACARSRARLASKASSRRSRPRPRSAEGVRRVEGWRCDELPVADGGEGTAEVLARTLGGEWRESPASDPLGRPVTARWLLAAGRDRGGRVGAGGRARAARARTSATRCVASTRRARRAAASRCSSTGPAAVLVCVGGTATVDGGAGLRRVAAALAGARAAARALRRAQPAARRARRGARVRPAEGRRARRRSTSSSAGSPRWTSSRRTATCRAPARAAASARRSRRSAASCARAPRSCSTLTRFDERARGAAFAVTGEGTVDETTLEGKAPGAVLRHCRTSTCRCVALRRPRRADSIEAALAATRAHGSAARRARARRATRISPPRPSRAPPGEAARPLVRRAVERSPTLTNSCGGSASGAAPYSATSDCQASVVGSRESASSTRSSTYFANAATAASGESWRDSSRSAAVSWIVYLRPETLAHAHRRAPRPRRPTAPVPMWPRRLARAPRARLVEEVARAQLDVELDLRVGVLDAALDHRLPRSKSSTCAPLVVQVSRPERSASAAVTCGEPSRRPRRAAPGSPRAARRRARRARAPMSCARPPRRRLGGRSSSIGSVSSCPCAHSDRAGASSPSRRASSSILPLRAGELLGQPPVELLAALPELRQLVEPDVAALEPLDDPLELGLLLPRRSARALIRRAPRTSRRRPRPRARSRPAAARGRARRRRGRSRSRARASRAARVRAGGRASRSSRARRRSSASSGARRRRSCVRREALGVALDDAARAALEPAVGAVEPRVQLGEVRHDEPSGDGRRRGADVGGEVDERRVLLVPDRRDDRHRARGDRAHEPLVGERQQVLERPAAAGAFAQAPRSRSRGSCCRSRSACSRATPGCSVAAAIVMSVIVFAGSAQFAAISILRGRRRRGRGDRRRGDDELALPGDGDRARAVAAGRARRSARRRARRSSTRPGRWPPAGDGTFDRWFLFGSTAVAVRHVADRDARRRAGRQPARRPAQARARRGLSRVLPRAADGRVRAAGARRGVALPAR